jgi:hypothetical protein
MLKQWAFWRKLTESTPLPSPAQQRLKALVTRLKQVSDDLTVHKQRRVGLLDKPEMLISLVQVIALFEAPIPPAGGRDRFYDSQRSAEASLAETSRVSPIVPLPGCTPSYRRSTSV